MRRSYLLRSSSDVSGDSFMSSESSSPVSVQSDGGGRRAGGRKKKFVGVRQRPSGRWVAEIKDTTKNIRLWLGTFDTAEAAARAYDEAACMLRGANTRTNFITHPSPPTSPLASKLAHIIHLRRSCPSPPSSSSSIAAAADDYASSPELLPPPPPVVQPTTAFLDPLFDDSTQLPPFAMHLDGFPLIDELSEKLAQMEQPLPQEDAEVAAEHNPACSMDMVCRMRVERRISASLYAINGVQEWLEHSSLSPHYKVPTDIQASSSLDGVGTENFDPQSQEAIWGSLELSPLSSFFVA